jgi:hypothetical protein
MIFLLQRPFTQPTVRPLPRPPGANDGTGIRRA